MSVPIDVNTGENVIENIQKKTENARFLLGLVVCFRK
jgi:hypothetical protein